MSNNKNYLQDHLVETINKSDNEEYKKKMIEFLAVMGCDKIYEIMKANHFELDSHKSEVKDKIIKTFIENMSQEDIESYVSRLFRRKKITPQNLVQFIRDNDKHFDIIIKQLKYTTSFRPGNEKAAYKIEEIEGFLCEAFQDKILEARILLLANEIRRKSGIDDTDLYGFIINAYISNNEIEKALALHKEKGLVYVKELHPLRLFERMLTLGHTDKMTKYFLNNENLKKEFNGSYNRQFQNLQSLLKIFLKADKEKAIDFFSKPQIVEIHYGTADLNALMDIMMDTNTDESLVFKYLTSDGISEGKYQIGLLQEHFGKIGKKYGTEFLKNVLLHKNGRRGKRLMDNFDPQASGQKILERINEQYRYELTKEFI